MPKIKVLYISSTLGSGGPTNVIFNIVKYLDRERFEPVILICLKIFCSKAPTRCNTQSRNSPRYILC